MGTLVIGLKKNWSNAAYILPVLLVVIAGIAVYRVLTEPPTVLPIWTVVGLLQGFLLCIVLPCVFGLKGTVSGLVADLMGMRLTDLPFVAAFVTPFILDWIFRPELTAGQSYAAIILSFIALGATEWFAFRMRETTGEKRRERRKGGDRRKG